MATSFTIICTPVHLMPIDFFFEFKKIQNFFLYPENISFLISSIFICYFFSSHPLYSILTKDMCYLLISNHITVNQKTILLFRTFMFKAFLVCDTLCSHSTFHSFVTIEPKKTKEKSGFWFLILQAWKHGPIE